MTKKKDGPAAMRFSAKKLTALRKKAALRQHEVSIAIRDRYGVWVSPQRISSWENAQHEPEATALLCLMGFYDVRHDDLLEPDV